MKENLVEMPQSGIQAAAVEMGARIEAGVEPEPKERLRNYSLQLGE